MCNCKSLGTFQKTLALLARTHRTKAGGPKFNFNFISSIPNFEQDRVVQRHWFVCSRHWDWQRNCVQWLRTHAKLVWHDRLTRDDHCWIAWPKLVPNHRIIYQRITISTNKNIFKLFSSFFYLKKKTISRKTAEICKSIFVPRARVCVFYFQSFILCSFLLHNNYTSICMCTLYTIL